MHKLWTALFAAALLSAQIPDFTPPTPLFRAVMDNDTARTKQLLDAGADPNENIFKPTGFMPIFFAIVHRNTEIVRALVAKGADIKVVDTRGNTTLMWAAINEHASPELVEELLRLGVDPNLRNKAGQTALDLARQRGNTPIVAALLKAGASQDKNIQRAAESAVAVLQKSGPSFVKVSGCVSCHHQSLPQMAIGEARLRGLAVNEEISKQQIAATMAMYKPAREVLVKNPAAIPDVPITVSYGLLGLFAEGYRPDETTRAMAEGIALTQTPDGSFRSFPARPPMESSDFTATALGLRALQLYGDHPEAKIERAKQWLLAAKPKTMEERAMRLMGLAWSKAPAKEIAKAIRALEAEQRADGGWSQLATLESDAYATGQALYALHIAGVKTVSPIYQRGINYLLRTQLADGSWLVRSRSIPVQPLKESGFPHGRDQWISAAGTSWAAMALSVASPARSSRALSE
jgi:hypothetical protein